MSPWRLEEARVPTRYCHRYSEEKRNDIERFDWLLVLRKAGTSAHLLHVSTIGAPFNKLCTSRIYRIILIMSVGKLRSLFLTYPMMHNDCWSTITQLYPPSIPPNQRIGQSSVRSMKADVPIRKWGGPDDSGIRSAFLDSTVVPTSRPLALLEGMETRIAAAENL